MIESKLFNSIKPYEMIMFLNKERRASDRKLRLFAVACCRRIWHRFKDERSREAVNVAERYADGLATEEEALTALRRADEFWCITADDYNPSGADPLNVFDYSIADSSIAEAAVEVVQPDNFPNNAIHVSNLIANPLVMGKFCDAEQIAHCELLRDIFGNPFRSDDNGVAELSGDIVALAQVIYDRNEFERMPELAQFLDSAGCGDIRILNHCRTGPNHVRGCWTIDFIIGKS